MNDVGDIMKYKYLNLKYALINAFYLFLICATIGYAANYLLSKGFSNSVVGTALAAVSICGVLFQGFFAPIIDRSQKLDEKRFISITLILTAVMSLLMYLMPSASVFLLVLVVIGFTFANAGMPFINSIAFIYEKEGQTINYGLCRGIGSAAYAVGSLVIGRYLNLTLSGGREPASYLPLIYIAIALVTLLLVWTLETPERHPSQQAEAGEKANYAVFFRKYSHLLPVLCGMVLIYTCHMMINNFMINVITNVGGNSANQGTALFLQAMSELPPMFMLSKILAKFDVDKVMAFAGIFYSVKHLLVWMAPNIAVLYGSMLLQMLSYALMMPAAVYFANKHIREEDRNQGQAVMMWTTTVGGIIASLIGGVLMDHLSVSAALLIGFIISVAGTLMMVWGIRRLKAE